MKGKIIGFTALLFACFNASSENIGSCGNSNSSTEDEKIIQLSEQEQWFQNFYISKLDDKNPILQAHAIYALDSYGNNKSNDQLKTKLKPLINKSKTNKRLQLIVRDICNRDNFKKTCQQNNFNQNLPESNNLLDFSVAMKESLKEKSRPSKELINKINKTSHATIIVGVGASELKDSMEIYQLVHPMPTKSPSELFDIFKYIDISNQEESQKIMTSYSENQIENTINTNVLFVTSQNMFDVSDMAAFCSGNDIQKTCSHMADLLTNKKSNSYLKYIGYDILMSQYYENEDLEHFKETSIAIIRLNEFQNCEYTNNNMNSPQLTVEPLFMNIYIDNIEKLGEQKTNQLLVEELDNYLFDHDLLITKSDQDCEAILELSNQDLIEKYQLQESLDRQLEFFYSR